MANDATTDARAVRATLDAASGNLLRAQQRLTTLLAVARLAKTVRARKTAAHAANAPIR